MVHEEAASDRLDERAVGHLGADDRVRPAGFGDSTQAHFSLRPVAQIALQTGDLTGLDRFLALRRGTVRTEGHWGGCLDVHPNDN